MSAKIHVARRAALAVCTVLALGACSSEGEKGVQAGAESLIAANPAMSGLSDPNIIAAMDAINAADSATGSVAASKGTDAQVREYGQMMVTEHHAMRVEGRELATRLAITPEPPANDASEASLKAVMSSLEQTARGEGFDRTYIASAIRMHEDALGAARNAERSTTNADVRALVQKAIPAIERHLNRAREIQQRIGGADTTAAGGR